MKHRKVRYISPTTAALYMLEITDDSDGPNEGLLIANLSHGQVQDRPTYTSTLDGMDDLVNVKIPALVFSIENPEL